LNLRDNPSLEDIVISIKIESDDIKNTLIDKYNYSDLEWIHVEILGTVKSIYLPINGAETESVYIEVNNLIFK